jgi:putative hemolysin
MKTILTLIMGLLLLVSCTTPQSQPAQEVVLTDTPQANLPNPASAFCEQQGYKVEIRTAVDGSQAGFCIFPDGSECDEWAYFREECQPGASLVTSETPVPEVVETPTGASDLASDGCNLYRNQELGYSFHYPMDASLQYNDDPLHGITIVGPTVSGETWPSIGVAHPRDREEYRPPEEADLVQWMTDHYLMADTRMDDVQIAGTTAIHTHFDRSPQSYASDRYYFANSGQLYVITILHTGDKEDWNLYNHFLESIQFDQSNAIASAPTAIPTARPIEPADYQGFWTYTHAEYGFSIMLPEDWVVDETTTFDPEMSGHTLILHPEKEVEKQSIRMTFRRVGEEAMLWPTGVGAAEFFPQGKLNIAGQPARRLLLVCPTGEITSIWYQGDEGETNIQRGDMEFAFIFSYADSFCEAGYSLGGKVQYLGELIIASLYLP